MATARLLDITRLTSRAGRVPTGIDRVERAYLAAIIAQSVPCFGIAKTALGYVLLDRAGMTQLLSHVDGMVWRRPDLAARLNRRISDAAKSGQSTVRRIACARASASGLDRLLRKNLPPAFAYINVGHSNLTERMLSSISRQLGTSITVMIHDAIPLDYPKWQRPGTVEEFADKLRQVSRFASQVITISQAAQREVVRHLKRIGRVPPMVCAHIGVDLTTPGPVPPGIQPDGPYFITIGTIEPRKNHLLLLEIWRDLPPDSPTLLICGRRGWENAAVFAQLDEEPRGVKEVSEVKDDALASLIKGSKGLLFPSFAEGFGLPPVEAAALGTPVVCANLPVYREFLGKGPVYVDPNDGYHWKKEIKRLTDAQSSLSISEYCAPTWDAHFKIVFTLT